MEQEERVLECFFPLDVWRRQKKHIRFVSFTEVEPHRVEVDLIGSEEEILKRGEVLFSMAPEEIELEFGIGSFSDFAPGTVFVYTSIETVTKRLAKDPANNKVYIMSYEMKDGEKIRRGKVFLPPWIIPQAKKSKVGVIVYKGKQMEKNAREYFDLQLLPLNSTILSV